MKKIIKTEKEFSMWFRKNYKKLGYSKMIRGDISRFPDFIMLKNGKEIRVELETLASNFLLHKHDINKVDEIVCLIKDAKIAKPIKEVKELEFKGKRKVTLSIESEVYNNFQRYCEENAIMLSKIVELDMKKMMKNREQSKR